MAHTGMDFVRVAYLLMAYIVMASARSRSLGSLDDARRTILFPDRRPSAVSLGPSTLADVGRCGGALPCFFWGGPSGTVVSACRVRRSPSSEVNISGEENVAVNNNDNKIMIIKQINE